MGVQVRNVGDFRAARDRSIGFENDPDPLPLGLAANNVDPSAFTYWRFT
jgi:hypothetical protein